MLHSGDIQYVIKDYIDRPAWIRRTWGRLVINREVKAYQCLAGFRSAPAFIAKVDSCAFLMEHVAASQLPRRKRGRELGLSFFEQLHAAVNEMHARGVAHGDIRKNNLLVREDGSPCIIDFQTCAFDSIDPIRHRIFNYISRLDDLTVVKLKKRFLPKLVGEREQEILSATPLSLKVGRFIRRRIYRPLSPKVLKPKTRRLLQKLTGK